MRLFFPILLLFPAWTCLCPALPQPRRLLIKNYTTQDGLPDSRVAPIMQDRKGYLWFGTQAGLTRYDGREFRTFGGAKDIPGIFGRHIFEDHSGAVWFAYTGFRQGGLMRYVDGTMTEFDREVQAIGGNAIAVVEDSAGAIWVSSGDALLRLQFRDSSRTSWDMQTFPNVPASALFVDSRHRLWIGTSSGELICHHDSAFEWIASGFDPYIRPYAFHEGRDGKLWVGGIFGAAIVEEGAVQRYGTADGLPPWGVWCFCEDMNGNFWVGSSDGLYQMRRTGSRVRFSKEPTFGNAVVYDMCLDAEGNLWFASHPGLRKLLASDLVVGFPGSDTFATPGFGPIAQRADGTLLFGSRNAGVFSLSGDRVRSGAAVKPFRTYTVLSIFPETPARTWYGFKQMGVILQDGETTTPYTAYPPRDYLSVHCMERTSVGGLLLGTSQGLMRVGRGDSLHALSDPAIDSLVIFDITPAGESGDDYWLATNKGLRFIRLDGWTVRMVKDPAGAGLGRTIVYTLLTDRQRHLWCGTDGEGLVMLDGERTTRYTTEDGLVGNRVFALARDSLGLLWVGTSSGLSQFDGSSFRNLVHDQGFGEIGLHGLLTDREGFLWVSSFPGISKLYPQRFYKSTRPPPIFLFDMQVDGRPYLPGDTIELSPGSAVITFHYAGLSFTDESHVRYKYQLVGFDQEWSDPVPGREVRYTHLSQGRYTFRVIARSADGVWSRDPARLSLVILPPLWARWWFVAASLVLCAGLAYGAYRYRLARALQLERTRGRIAMDLHDDVGASLTRISLMTEVAQRVAHDGPPAVGEYLGKIGDTARELIDSLGDIVWSVDPSHDTVQDVIRRLVDFGEDVCGARGIEFETFISPQLQRIRMDLESRRDFYLLFKEALHNAVKHAQAGRIVLRAEPAFKGVSISISDDGCGFLPGEIQTGHGLASMSKRAERLRAELCYVTVPDKGTTVKVDLKTT